MSYIVGWLDGSIVSHHQPNINHSVLYPTKVLFYVLLFFEGKRGKEGKKEARVDAYLNE
jgi:hypothetical protein